MNAFLNPRSGTSLTNTIDVTAHSISSFQENERPKDTNCICIPQTNISIAEPIDVQIDALGDNIIHLYQAIGSINDEKAPGLESILSYMNENSFIKDDPAINEHYYHITKNNTAKKHTTYTKHIRPKPII